MDENDEGDIDHDALHATMRSRVEQRHISQFGPSITVDIPTELYQKARNHQDELTEPERQLLLSRGDTIGKALAQPSSLSESERNEILGRPPPDIVRMNIEHASQGRMTTTTELIAKAFSGIETLNKDELMLLANNFSQTTSEFMRRCNDASGAREASTLLTPADDKKAMIAAAQLQILGPGTDIATYLATQQAAQEQRVAAEAVRMKKFYENELQHQNISDRQRELLQQRDTLSVDEFQTQSARLESDRDTTFSSSNALRYDPLQERNVPRLRDHDNRVQQSNHQIAQIEYLDLQLERGIIGHEDHSQQVNGHYDAIRNLATGSTHRTHPYSAAARPVYAAAPSHRNQTPSAFTLYANEQRERVRAENPGMTLGFVGKVLGEEWKGLSEQERARYEAEATAAATPEPQI